MNQRLTTKPPKNSIAAGLFYLLVTASLAELASAIPSSAGIYHWATLTPGSRGLGRVVGFFAGYWNALAYALGSASLAAIGGQAILQMWALTHEGFAVERWHVFVVYLLLTWANVAVLLFANRALPQMNNIFMALGYGGWLVSIVALAVLPTRRQGGVGAGAGVGVEGEVVKRQWASSSFVWSDWQNNTGYSSDGLVFVLGMLNGAFNIGTPDCSTHMAEEVPRPSVNIPIAMGVQMVASFLSTIVYLVALLYAITDWDAVLESSAAFPLAEIYHQATGSSAGAIGLTIVLLLPLLGSALGAMMTASRAFWTLARDGAVPFSDVFGRVHPRHRTPVAAILFVGCFCTAMGLIYLGSDVAFQAMVGSFAVLVALSYLAALVPYLLRGKAGIKKGPFSLGDGVFGFAVTAVSCLFLSVWVVFYCFPYAMPVAAADMNYSSVITAGLTALVGCWYLYVRKTYQGPPLLEP